jgi:hypothetical protein
VSAVSEEENVAAKHLVENFLNYVTEGDFAKAESLWRGKSKRILEGSDHTILFPVFCEKFANIGNYAVTDVFIDNEVYWIKISWVAHGKNSQWRFDLVKDAGKWYFIRGYQW